MQQLRNQININMLPLILVLVAVGVIATGIGMPETVTDRMTNIIDRRMPSFSLPLYGSDKGDLLVSSAWKDKVTIINVFGSWSADSHATHESLMKLAKAGVKAVGIGWKDNPSNLQQYFAQAGNPYQVVGYDVDGNLTLVLGVTMVPTTYVVDKYGIVRWKQSGPLTVTQINNELLPLLQKLHEDK